MRVRHTEDKHGQTWWYWAFNAPFMCCAKRGLSTLSNYMARKWRQTEHSEMAFFELATESFGGRLPMPWTYHILFSCTMFLLYLSCCSRNGEMGRRNCSQQKRNHSHIAVNREIKRQASQHHPPRAVAPVASHSRKVAISWFTGI